MDPVLLRYAEQPSPRYTSYPTAPHFTEAVDAGTVRTWLADLPADATLSLYLHIPFCREICRYCGCHTYATRRDEPIASYTDTMAKEIALVAAATPARRVTHIAWGGGTPNILRSSQFRTLCARLRERFDLSGLIEHAVEIDPRLLTADMAHVLGEEGVTRASLGVQDVNPHVQAAIGRIQCDKLVRNAVQMLRAAGVGAVSIDLMYGLPLQTVEDVRRSARVAAALAPDRLATFGYAHVPWFKKRQRLIDEADLPGTEMRFAQAAALREELEASGFVALGFDHFARSDDPLAKAAKAHAMKRSFQGFSCDTADALVGLGASAISTYPQGYAQNAPEPGAWSRAIDAGHLATARGVALNDDDRTRRAIIDRLLCDFAVDLAPFGGAQRFSDALGRCGQLVRDGLAQLDGDRVVVTPRGRPFARLVAEAFDAYRADGAARHSRSV